MSYIFDFLFANFELNMNTSVQSQKEKRLSKMQIDIPKSVEELMKLEMNVLRRAYQKNRKNNLCKSKRT